VAVSVGLNVTLSVCVGDWDRVKVLVDETVWDKVAEAVGLAVGVRVGLWVSLKLGVDDAVALEVGVGDAVQDGVTVSEGVTVSVAVPVFEPVAVALALSVGDELMLGVALGLRVDTCVSVTDSVTVAVVESLVLGAAVRVCEAETVLLGEGEKVSGEGSGERPGKTNVSRGVGTLKKGLSGSLGLILPVGPLSQNGKAWPKPGNTSKKNANAKRDFTIWHSRTGLCEFRSPFTIKLMKVRSHRPPYFYPSYEEIRPPHPADIPTKIVTITQGFLSWCKH
jgi:hypothetical protein